MFNTAQIVSFLTLLVALFAVQSVDAQQLCYSYDLLGRLTGVIDQNNQAAFYDYDSVGNILAIRRESPAGPVNILSVHPPGGTAGTRVDLFGYGFSTTASQNQVTLNGVQLSVLSSTRCHLRVEILSGTTSGQFAVTTPLGKANSSQVFSSFGMSILAPATGLVPGASLQLAPIITGCPNSNIIWSVNGIVGGNATVGTISPTGLYTAPSFALNDFVVTIAADSIGCPGLSAEVTLYITGASNHFVSNAVSVSFGLPTLAPSPAMVAGVVSVLYGSTQTTPAPAMVATAVSVANGPVIMTLSSGAVARGTTFTLNVIGTNLAGASALEFQLPTGPDPNIVVSNLTVNTAGDVLTADVTISGAAQIGDRILVVKNAVANSILSATQSNVLRVTGP